MTLKRSPLKPGKPLQRKSPMNRTGVLSATSFARTKASDEKPKRRAMKHGKKPANAAESAWMASVAALGCIVCRRQGRGFVPCAVHHIIEGGRRVGHMSTIGLCDPGHHQNSPDPAQISRHPNKARFVAAYGTEYELLAETQALMGAT
jgi:hypothetical protein